MLVKTVRVTNAKNVVLQIPGFVTSMWGLTTDSILGVYYDDETEAITIKPYVQGRGRSSERLHEVAKTSGT